MRAATGEQGDVCMSTASLSWAEKNTRDRDGDMKTHVIMTTMSGSDQLTFTADRDELESGDGFKTSREASLRVALRSEVVAECFALGCREHATSVGKDTPWKDLEPGVGLE